MDLNIAKKLHFCKITNITSIYLYVLKNIKKSHENLPRGKIPLKPNLLNTICTVLKDASGITQHKLSTRQTKNCVMQRISICCQRSQTFPAYWRLGGRAGIFLRAPDMSKQVL